MRSIAEIGRQEDRLRAAMLASDIDELDRILSAGSVFTDHNGRRLTKLEDLAAHRSGLLKVNRIDAVGDRIVRMFGDAAIVCVTTTLEGTYAGHPFAGTFAYSRVWHRSGDDWRVELGHCSEVVQGS